MDRTSSSALWSSVIGLLAGAALALWMATAWHSLPLARMPIHQGAAESTAAEPSDAKALSHPIAGSIGGRTAADAPASPPAMGCQFEPLLQPANARDGAFVLGPVLSVRPDSLPRTRAYVAAGQEAARQGRIRDSEVALIAACRLASRDSARFAVPVADVQVLLAQRYRELASKLEAFDAREDLLDRAKSLLRESFATYTVALGSQASKSRLTAHRLAALQDWRGTDQAFENESRAGEPVDHRVEPDRESAGIGRSWVSANVVAAREVNPTSAVADSGQRFIPKRCAGETSLAMRTVCADPELSQLHWDLQRLGTQAAHITDDPHGFRQRTIDARARREAQCRDKACLMRWYSQRKQELLAEF